MTNKDDASKGPQTYTQDKRRFTGLRMTIEMDESLRLTSFTLGISKSSLIRNILTEWLRSRSFS